MKVIIVLETDTSIKANMARVVSGEIEGIPTSVVKCIDAENDLAMENGDLLVVNRREVDGYRKAMTRAAKEGAVILFHTTCLNYNNSTDSTEKELYKKQLKKFFGEEWQQYKVSVYSGGYSEHGKVLRRELSCDATGNIIGGIPNMRGLTPEKLQRVLRAICVAWIEGLAWIK